MLRNLCFVVALSFGCVFAQNENKFQKSILNAQNAINASNLDSALNFSKIALKEAFATNNHLSKAKSYSAIGECFYKLSDSKKAIFYFEKGLNEAVFTNNDSVKGYLNANLGLVFEKYDSLKAIELNKKSLFYINKICNSDREANLLLKNYKSSIKINFNRTSKINLVNYQKQILIVEKNNEKPFVNLQDSGTVDLLLIVIIGVLLLLVFSLLRNNKLRNVSNTELRATNFELLLAKEKAEKATQLKSQFVSSITHELRTPLYGVVGITNIIIDEHKELTNSPHLISLKFSANYLLSLVNDLLQINKIEERKIILENSFFNLSQELTTIVNSLQFLTKKNSNIVVIDVDKSISTTIFSDKLRLSQIFINLISNALKFTKNGTITITAKLAAKDQKQQFVTFYIKDTGIGISKSNQEEIFEKFVQIERNEDDYQGTGLGLSIVKNLVEIFGGKIEIESDTSKGSTFYFTIPFLLNSENYSEPKKIVPKVFKEKSCHVLVVEDNKINQIVTRKILEKNNFKCTVVDNGYESIDVLTNEKIDIILMDINMPIINGYETTKLIRSKGFKLPIIALTAFDRQEIIAKVFESGMNEIIIKPFEKEKLFQIISDMISQND